MYPPGFNYAAGVLAELSCPFPNYLCHPIFAITPVGGVCRELPAIRKQETLQRSWIASQRPEIFWTIQEDSWFCISPSIVQIPILVCSVEGLFTVLGLCGHKTTQLWFCMHFFLFLHSLPKHFTKSSSMLLRESVCVWICCWLRWVA